MQITHLLFMDDVLIFCSGNVHDVDTISNILGLFPSVTGMEINAGKSSLTTHGMDDVEVRHATTHFPFNRATLDEGLKYLGSMLKPNNYLNNDRSALLRYFILISVIGF